MYRTGLGTRGMILPDRQGGQAGNLPYRQERRAKYAVPSGSLRAEKTKQNSADRPVISDQFRADPHPPDRKWSFKPGRLLRPTRDRIGEAGLLRTIKSQFDNLDNYCEVTNIYYVIPFSRQFYKILINLQNLQNMVSFKRIYPYNARK